MALYSHMQQQLAKTETVAEVLEMSSVEEETFAKVSVVVQETRKVSFAEEEKVERRGKKRARSDRSPDYIKLGATHTLNNKKARSVTYVPPSQPEQQQQYTNKFARVEQIPHDQAVYKCDFKTERRLVAFNLTKDTTLEHVYAAFRPFGFIKNMWMVTDGLINHENFAFVEFEDAHSVKLALEHMYGATINMQAIGVVQVRREFDRTARKIKVFHKNCPYTNQQISMFFSLKYLQANCGSILYTFPRVFGPNVHTYMVFYDVKGAANAEQHFTNLGFQVQYIL